MDMTARMWGFEALICQRSHIHHQNHESNSNQLIIWEWIDGCFCCCYNNNNFNLKIWCLTVESHLNLEVFYYYHYYFAKMMSVSPDDDLRHHFASLLLRCILSMSCTRSLFQRQRWSHSTVIHRALGLQSWDGQRHPRLRAYERVRCQPAKPVWCHSSPGVPLETVGVMWHPMQVEHSWPPQPRATVGLN